MSERNVRAQCPFRNLGSENLGQLCRVLGTCVDARACVRKGDV